jgi:uncharacterized membrane protein HdeD (DUF308 family)
MKLPDFTTEDAGVPEKCAFHPRAGRTTCFAMSDANQNKSPGWTLFQGILLIVLGGLAIAFPLIGTVVVEQLFAALLLIAGGYALAAALGRKDSGTASRVVSGLWAILTLVTGLLLMFQVGAGMLTLTILLAAYFAAQGLVTVVAAFKFSGTGTMWLMLLSGVVSLVLAWMIFSGFPGSATWLLGLLFGINLIFTGFYFLSMSSTLRAQGA